MYFSNPKIIAFVSHIMWTSLKTAWIVCKTVHLIPSLSLVFILYVDAQSPRLYLMMFYEYRNRTISSDIVMSSLLSQISTNWSLVSVLRPWNVVCLLQRLCCCLLLSGSNPGTMVAHRLMQAVKSKCSPDEAMLIVNELSPMNSQSSVESVIYWVSSIDSVIYWVCHLMSLSSTESVI